MSYFKITVMKKMANQEYAKEYCKGGISVCPCPAFEEGQEFITEVEKPAEFCEWAWSDIYKYLVVFRSGGNMGDSFKWMKENNTVIACCTDGIRPVVFKIERIND